MIYEWRCEECGKKFDVYRRTSADYLKPPARCIHSLCRSKSFKKCVSVPSRLAMDSGREDRNFPLKVDFTGKKLVNPGIDGVSVGSDGVPVAKDIGAYRKLLDANGLIMTSDLYNTGVGLEESSQRSWDDPIALTPAQKFIYENSRFLTPEEITEEFNVTVPSSPEP